MNIELYESLRKQINDKLEEYIIIGIPIDVQKEIRVLLKQNLESFCKTKPDSNVDNYAAVMMAFYYETTRKYPVFNNLIQFYANFFEIAPNGERLNSIIKIIKNNEDCYEAFFEIARVDTIKKVYEGIIKNAFMGENLEFYDKFKEKMCSLGLEEKAVVIDAMPVNHAEAEESLQEINYRIDNVKSGESLVYGENPEETISYLVRKKETIEKALDERQEGLFDEAAINLGVTSDELLTEAGGKELNYDIDKIVVMPKVIKKSEPIKTCSKTALGRFITRVRRKRFLKNLDFEYFEFNDSNILMIKTMDGFFDKIASGDKTTILEIIENASRKSKLASCITPMSDAEVLEMLEELRKNHKNMPTSEFFDILGQKEQSVDDFIKEAKASMGYIDFVPLTESQGKVTKK